MNERQLKLVFELVWWILTVVAVLAVMYPILRYVKNYPFYFINVLYIVTFITLTRYLFFMKHTFFAKWQRFKFILIILSIPFIFLIVQELHFFQTFLDERGEGVLVGNLPSSYRGRMIKYIYNEVLLFGVGSIMVSVAFPLRLILSIWRTHNGYND